MSSVPKQAGTEVSVGFEGMTWSGYIPEDGFQAIQAFQEMEELYDTNGATRTKIRTNPYSEWTGDVVIDAGSNTILTEGDTISITVPNAGGTGTALIAEVQGGTQTQLNRKSIKLSVTLRKEDSMTYTTS